MHVPVVIVESVSTGVRDNDRRPRSIYRLDLRRLGHVRQIGHHPKTIHFLNHNLKEEASN
jgi:hypothetical protein